jgi:Ser-tRNA(Ala) deacylase AlaX
VSDDALFSGYGKPSKPVKPPSNKTRKQKIHEVVPGVADKRWRYVNVKQHGVVHAFYIAVPHGAKAWCGRLTAAHSITDGERVMQCVACWTAIKSDAKPEPGARRI